MKKTAKLEKGKKVELPLTQELPKLMDEIAILKRMLKEEKEKADEYLTHLKHFQADFENYRERTSRELEEALKYACEQLIGQLLTVVDSLELALESARETSDKDSLVKGVEMTLKCLGEILKEEGLLEVEALGKPFDPNLHQAVEQVSVPTNSDKPIIVEELRKGYIFKGKLIRPSVVKVGKVEKGENSRSKNENWDC